jgi:hypothetical protein
MIMSKLAPLNPAPLNCAHKILCPIVGSRKREAPRDKPVASPTDFWAKTFYACRRDT